MFLKGSLSLFFCPDSVLPNITTSSTITNSPRVATSTGVRISTAIAVRKAFSIAFKGLDEYVDGKLNRFIH
jgi:hypothetical protein